MKNIPHKDIQGLSTIDRNHGAESHTAARCTVKYENGKWIFTVPGEGKVTVKDSKQIRVVCCLLLNMSISMEPDDIEEASSSGPYVVKGGYRPDDDSFHTLVRRSEDCLAADDEDMLAPDDHGVSEAESNVDEDDDREPYVPDAVLEGTFRSSSDPDLLMRCHVEQRRYTGDAGDYEALRAIDRRLATLKGGIVAAEARGDAKGMAALGQEKIALRKARDWYYNSVGNRFRLFYSKEADDKAHRCRMWTVRGLQTLAKGLPRASASLMVAIERGMEFIYRRQPGYLWVVTAPPPGSLPVLPKVGVREDGSEVAA